MPDPARRLPTLGLSLYVYKAGRISGKQGFSNRTLVQIVYMLHKGPYGVVVMVLGNRNGEIKHICLKWPLDSTP